MDPEYPEDETPESSGFGKSAILFVVTMGAVFGLGMIWTTYGERIAFEWRRGWNGMTESWAETTKPKKKTPNNMIDFSAMGPGGKRGEDFDEVNYELNSQRNRSNDYRRGVVRLIDTRKSGR